MVVDVNNHPPVFQFQSPYKMNIAEDAKPGTGLGVVKATDKDWGENAKITYKFVQANIGILFLFFFMVFHFLTVHSKIVNYCM